MYSVGPRHHLDSSDKRTRNQEHPHTESNRHLLVTSHYMKFGHKSATNLTSSRPILEVHMESRQGCTPLCDDKGKYGIVESGLTDADESECP
ncbi:uncharacterized protein ARMOST_21043 [Armillaria ostoyae]|uniref:Uncharacterized protein n=1 Tax=Armillaria ostoyae TaxID=47428 RepID=A0A284S908_ARMOS|nr:uncharacterized protein ARMOST_21043 [Armillaria ostoyae]